METLVTKLHGLASDPKLYKIDEAAFSYTLTASTTAANRKITILVSATADPLPKVRVVGGNFTDSTLSSNLGTELTLSTGSNDIYLANGSGTLFIGGFRDNCILDAICSFGSTGLFKYIPSMINLFKGSRFEFENVDFSEVSVDEAFPIYASPSRVSFSASMIHGDFKNIPAKDSLQILYISNCAINDQISTFAKFKNLAVLVFSNTLTDGANNITGTIDSLLDAMHTAGRTSGTMSVQGYNTGVTYNGNPFTSGTVTFTAGGWSIS